jgi:thioredoxin reductase
MDAGRGRDQCRNMEISRKLLVIGGGIAGLCAAVYARRCGYEVELLEQHDSPNISVDHPGVVANYRTARAIALRVESGEATTEDLRKAVVHYRALFDELLELGDQRTAVSP